MFSGLPVVPKSDAQACCFGAARSGYVASDPSSREVEIGEHTWAAGEHSPHGYRMVAPMPEVAAQPYES